MDKRHELTLLLLSNGEGFSHVCRMILQQKLAGAFWHWPAFYMNLGFCCELTLKGYSAFHGWSESKLRNEIGHDLNLALNNATKSGLVVSAQVGELIDHLSDKHRSHIFRYLRPEEIVVLDGPNALAAADQLVASVRQALPLHKFS